MQCLRSEGQHTFLPTGYLTQRINQRISVLPEYKRHTFTDRYWEVDAEFLDESLELRTEGKQSFAYLKFAYQDERLIEEKLRFLIGGPDITLNRQVTSKTWHDYLYDPKSVLAKKAQAEYEQAIAGQVAACERVFVRPLTVLSGAAGTGKTTVIKAIIKAVKKGHGVGTSVIALAPTGKAADRIREIIEKDPSLKGRVETSTIHSFLAKRQWLNENLTFKRFGGEVESGYSTVIVDESSMLNLALAACLFRAIQWEAVQRLILVGDPNQLPPIGCGRVFADVIDYLRQHQTESIAVLEDNLRLLLNRAEGHGTAILELANAYLRADALSDSEEETRSLKSEEILRRIQAGGSEDGTVDKDLRVIYWNEPEELAGLLIEQITEDLEEATGTDRDPDRPYELWRAGFEGRPDKFQVLTPYRGELVGTESLNAAVQQHLAKGVLDRIGAIDGITLFDKVIQVRNRPKSDLAYSYNVETRKPDRLELFNGELGFVKPHGFDGRSWMNPNGFWLKRFQVVFARKEQHWVNYGSDLGRFDDTHWIPRQPVAENLELAYAISVHKAQGSEFERTYVIVPKSKTTLLSPEMFYTALTRASRHCTLLIEQDIFPLVSMRRREKSHLLFINSSLFEFRPVPEPLLNMKPWYEEEQDSRDDCRRYGPFQERGDHLQLAGGGQDSLLVRGAAFFT